MTPARPPWTGGRSPSRQPPVAHRVRIGGWAACWSRVDGRERSIHGLYGCSTSRSATTRQRSRRRLARRGPSYPPHLADAATRRRPLSRACTDEHRREPQNRLDHRLPTGRGRLGSRQEKMKSLYLLCHAKSDWSEPTVADHDRPLNRRGSGPERLSPAMSRLGESTLWCVRPRDAAASPRSPWSPSWDVVCSTKRRCMPRSRSASSRSSGRCRTATRWSCWSGTTRRLKSSPRAVRPIAHLPTAALGTLDLAIDRWDEVSPRCGTLTAFVTARQLEASEQAAGIVACDLFRDTLMLRRFYVPFFIELGLPVQLAGSPMRPAAGPPRPPGTSQWTTNRFLIRTGL